MKIILPLLLSTLHREVVHQRLIERLTLVEFMRELGLNRNQLDNAYGARTEKLMKIIQECDKVKKVENWKKR